MRIFSLFGEIFINDREANESIDRVDKKGMGLSGTFGKIGTAVGAATLAIGAMAATAVVALGVKSVGASEDLKKALNGLQAQTGSTDEEIKGMRDSLLNIYNNNFGESFDDIAKAMAEVKKTTGLTGDELEKTTTNALMLRDTFELDVIESVNAANSLMKQFGISSEEAFNLIAQSAQLGANKNGDLLDSLNEYAPMFKALGMDVEDFGSVLVTGAQTGQFSIDKMGDAIKEFTIRSKDGSKSTAEAFTALGFNSDELQRKFAAGGEGARDAFFKVGAALESVKDPLTRNQLGTALWGTQFEDLQEKGISAITNLDGYIDLSYNSLEEINAIKYDTFGEAMTGIKRQFETSILIPIGDKVLPILNKFANWLQGKMPEIQVWITNAMDASSDVLDNFGKMWTWLKDNIIKPVMDWAVPFIQKTLASIKKYWDENGADIKQTLGTLMNWIKVIFQNVFPYIQGIVKIAFDVIGGTISAVVDVVSGAIKLLDGLFRGDWKKVFEGAAQIFEGVWGAMETVVKGAVNAMINMINNLIRGLNKLKFSFPDWIPGDMGGKSFGINISQIPMLAKGTDYFAGGMAIVGEAGPELVNMPRGSQVVPNKKTEDLLSGASQQPEYIQTHIYLDNREIAKVISEAQHANIQNRSRGRGLAFP